MSHLPRPHVNPIYARKRKGCRREAPPGPVHQSPAPAPRLVLRAWLQSRQPPGTREPWPAPGPRKPRPAALRLHAHARTYGHCRVCTGHARAVSLERVGNPWRVRTQITSVQTRFPKMPRARACVRRGPLPASKFSRGSLWFPGRAEYFVVASFISGTWLIRKVHKITDLLMVRR